MQRARSLMHNHHHTVVVQQLPPWHTVLPCRVATNASASTTQSLPQGRAQTRDQDQVDSSLNQDLVDGGDSSEPSGCTCRVSSATYSIACIRSAPNCSSVASMGSFTLQHEQHMMHASPPQQQQQLGCGASLRSSCIGRPSRADAVKSVTNSMWTTCSVGSTSSQPTVCHVTNMLFNSV